MATETQRAFESELDSEAAELHLAQLIHEAGEAARQQWQKAQTEHFKKMNAIATDFHITLSTGE